MQEFKLVKNVKEGDDPYMMVIANKAGSFCQGLGAAEALKAALSMSGWSFAHDPWPWHALAKGLQDIAVWPPRVANLKKPQISTPWANVGIVRAEIIEIIRLQRPSGS